LWIWRSVINRWQNILREDFEQRFVIAYRLQEKIFPFLHGHEKFSLKFNRKNASPSVFVVNDKPARYAVIPSRQIMLGIVEKSFGRNFFIPPFDAVNFLSECRKPWHG
jgi:hypothetical protein